MTQIEDLLRQALTETPAAAPTVDPLSTLDRRIRRARRRLAAAAGFGVAALVAAVVVPLTLTGRSSNNGSLQIARTPTPNASATGKAPAVWVTPPDAVAIATGDDGTSTGGVWALLEGNKSETGNVVKFDPATGIGSPVITVPGPVDFISVGLGRVWTYGGGDGGSGNLSVVSAIDPSTRHVETLRIHGDGGPQAMVFASQQAFVSLAVADKVVSVGGSAGPLAVGQSIAVPHQPTSMAVATDGSIWVDESLAKTWAHLSVADGQSRLRDTVSWDGPLLGPGSNGTVWTRDAPHRVVQIHPDGLEPGGSVSASYGYRVPTLGRPTAVVEPADGNGVYVATASPNLLHATISYYSPADESRDDNNEQPTATLTGVNVVWLAADPTGGVDFVTEDGALQHWNPTR